VCVWCVNVTVCSQLCKHLVNCFFFLNNMVRYLCTLRKKFHLSVSYSCMFSVKYRNLYENKGTQGLDLTYIRICKEWEWPDRGLIFITLITLRL
jgi:hypothetical protein